MTKTKTLQVCAGWREGERAFAISANDQIANDLSHGQARSVLYMLGVGDPIGLLANAVANECGWIKAWVS